MNELKNWGVADILIAVVDGLKGFPEAINAAFPETIVPTCWFGQSLNGITMSDFAGIWSTKGFDRSLFDAVTKQLRAKAVMVKTGTLVHATVIASTSEGDGDARWVKHKGKPAVHGFKAHVGADADTALVEELSITPANINDGRAAPDALPDNPGEVFADSAYRGNHFKVPVRAKDGIPRIVATGMWDPDGQETLRELHEWKQPIQRVRGRIEKIFGT